MQEAGLPASDHMPTPAEVDQIAALADPVIRNLQITQSYHELALAMIARTGICANWCTFATWASKQAGQTIRKEDLARLIDEAQLSAPPSAQAVETVTLSAQSLGSDRSHAEIQEAVALALNPLTALDRASDAVGRGNQKVYAEIGREFARFFETCLHDSHFDADHVTHFCETLRPGDPPDGQQYLRQAFTRYYQAFFETDPKTRAELMLLANIEIGFHEQTRLQPEIAEAMDAAFLDRRQFRQQLIQALFPYRGWFVRVRMFVQRVFNRPSLFDRVLDMLLDEARRRAHLIITAYLMTISFPGGVRLRLGRDVPGAFPPSLQQIMLPELCSLLEAIDPTPDSTRDSGAVDWAQLSDRLHFIVDLFRCYHESPTLFEPPFTAEQLTTLKAGHLPQGRL